MIEIKLDKMVKVPYAIVPILQEYIDVMPPELPKKLSPRRFIDHQIELVPRVKPLAQVPY